MAHGDVCSQVGVIERDGSVSVVAVSDRFVLSVKSMVKSERGWDERAVPTHGRPT